MSHRQVTPIDVFHPLGLRGSCGPFLVVDYSLLQGTVLYIFTTSYKDYETMYQKFSGCNFTTYSLLLGPYAKILSSLSIAIYPNEASHMQLIFGEFLFLSWSSLFLCFYILLTCDFLFSLLTKTLSFSENMSNNRHDFYPFLSSFERMNKIYCHLGTHSKPITEWYNSLETWCFGQLSYLSEYELLPSVFHNQQFKRKYYRKQTKDVPRILVIRNQLLSNITDAPPCVFDSV